MPSSCGEVAAQTLVAAPCSGVLKPGGRRLPSSSIQPEADHLLARQVALQRGHDAARVHARTRARRRPGRARRAARRTARWRSWPARTPATCRSRARTACRPSGCRERCPADDSATTRAPPPAASAGQSRLVSAKWPRWLVANCASQPGPTRVSGAGHDAALLMSRSICGRSRGTARRSARTLSRSPRSSSSTSTPSIPGQRLARVVGPARGDDDVRARRSPARASSRARCPSSRR